MIKATGNANKNTLRQLPPPQIQAPSSGKGGTTRPVVELDSVSLRSGKGGGAHTLVALRTGKGGSHLRSLESTATPAPGAPRGVVEQLEGWFFSMGGR